MSSGGLGSLRKLVQASGFRGRTAAALLGLHISSTVFESFGLAILLPVLEFIRSNGNAEALAAQSETWGTVVKVFATLHLPLTLPALLAASFFAIVLRQVFTYFRLVYMASVQNGLTTDLRSRMFRAYLLANAGWHDKTAMGDVVNDMTTDLVRGVAALFSMVVLAGYVFMVITYTGVMLALSPPLTFAALGMVAVAALALRRLFRNTAQIGHQVTQANQAMSTFLVERLKSVRLVRLCGMEPAETRAMECLTNHQRTTMVHLMTLMARLEIVVEPIVVGLGLAFLYTGVTRFGLNIEEIGLFLVIVLRLLPVLKEALRVRQSFLGSYPALETVLSRLHSMEAAHDVPAGQRAVDSAANGLAFEDVHFHYGRTNDRAALAGITLTMAPGAMTALVGPSGSGKSTLVDLLPRLRDPTAGRILLGGVPLTEYDLDSLRSAIAYVPQTPQIFNVSVADHIRYGKPDASTAEIRCALDLAGATDFVSRLPEGVDTLLGEGGLKLSGGQRQRLDLARALVRQAPILILDEPTSNLDAESEAAFRAALTRVRQEQGPTIVIVGHRLSTTMEADQIVVLHDGRIADVGNHAALTSRPGWYRDAFSMQLADNPAAFPQ